VAKMQAVLEEKAEEMEALLK
jgi:hypothetical protein